MASLFPSRYVQGYDAIKGLGAELAHFGRRPVLIGGRFVREELLPDLEAGLRETVTATWIPFGGECCDAELARLAVLAIEEGADVIVGVGGGKAVDAAKAVGEALHLPVAAVPTIASTDAPCNARVLMHSPEGRVDRWLRLERDPSLVVVDTRIIARAPVRFLVSGMGNALGTSFEAESGRRRHAVSAVGAVGTSAAFAVARMCFEILMEQGGLARTACEADTATPALEHVVEANILLSGLGYESGGMGAIHAICTGLKSAPRAYLCSHGEMMALASLASLFLTEQSYWRVDRVFAFCENVGLPTTLEDIGLGESCHDSGSCHSESQHAWWHGGGLMRCAEVACADGRGLLSSEMGMVTPVDVHAALLAASQEGGRRRSLMPKGAALHGRLQRNETDRRHPLEFRRSLS
ncbi:MAG: glycerol dehydrogenase [Alphaproteobacteria bacterium]